MFSVRKLLTAAGALVASIAISAVANAAPIGNTSFGLGGGFSLTSGSDLGNTDSIMITNGGHITVVTQDTGDLSAYITLGASGHMQDLPDLDGFTPIANFFSVNGVSLDLNSLSIDGRQGGSTGYLDMSGNGTLHAPGFDATSGRFSFSGTTTDNMTFSFAVETSAHNPPVPEPLSLSLLGLGLTGLAVRRRKTA